MTAPARITGELSRPLRIAIWHNLPSGGGKRQLYTHVQGLQQRGHYLESWCPDTADQKYLPLGALITEHVVPLAGLSQHFQNPLRRPRVTRQLLASMDDHCRTCAEAIHRGGFDVLFAGSCMYLRTTPIGRHIRLPSVLFLHEPFRWFYEAMPELPWLAPAVGDRPRLSWRSIRDRVAKRGQLATVRMQARAELEYLKRFDLVLANSVFSRETILRTYNIESKVCLLGIDSDYFKPTGEAKENFVVGLGTIYHGKGVDRAIRAVGAVAASRRPALIWIGNGAWDYVLDGYRALAARLKVDFVPKLHIPDADVISLLSRAKAMVYTSRLEPFGLAPLEANACGTPVVGIAEGGIKETIVEGLNGFLAPDDDVERLGALIERFVDDAELVSRMGAQAREHVRATWSLAAATDRIESRLLLLAAAKRGKTLLADSRKLLELATTGNIRCQVDESAVTRRALTMRGWAHINDGRDAAGSEIFVLLRNASDAQLLATTRTPRPDVTQYFADGRDYDDSGFFVQSDIRLQPPYAMGILIVRGAETALHVLS